MTFFGTKLSRTTAIVIAGLLAATTVAAAGYGAYVYSTGDLNPFGASDTETPADRTTTAASQPQAPTFFDKFGVQLMTGHENDWENAVEMGVKWARINPAGISAWARIEPQNNQYDWSQSQDWTVVNASKAGYEGKIIGIIAGTPYPAWLGTEQPCGPVPLEKIHEFAEFGAKVVERFDADGVGDVIGYDGNPVRIDYWEILNEPDTVEQGDVFIPECWGSHPDLYAELVKQMYTAIKAVDPTAQIVAGSGALCKEGDPRCQNWGGNQSDFNPNFYREFLSVSDVGNFFDVLSFHYYESAERDRWKTIGISFEAKISYLNELLSTNGIGKKPLMMSETNMCTGQTLDGKNYTEQDQANYFHKFAARTLSAGDDLLVNSWWEIKDTKDYANCGFYNFDSANPASGSTRKPMYYAYQDLKFIIPNATSGRALHHIYGEPEGIIPDKEGYSLTESLEIWWANYSGAAIHEVSHDTITVFSAESPTVQMLVHDGGPGDIDNIRNGKIKILLTDIPLYISTADNYCSPDCTGKYCGSDGCGGSCGTCPPEEACESGHCVAPDPTGTPDTPEHYDCVYDCVGAECEILEEYWECIGE